MERAAACIRAVATKHKRSHELELNELIKSANTKRDAAAAAAAAASVAVTGALLDGKIDTPGKLDTKRTLNIHVYT